MNKRIIITLLIVVITLCGCASNTDNKNKKIYSADVLYEKAIISVKANEYDDAIIKLRELLSIYPFSSLSDEAQIIMGYAYFKKNRMTDAEESFQHYLNSNTKEKYNEYAMYMIARCQFLKIQKFKQDLHLAEKAYNSINIFMTQFPNSRYFRDMELRKEIVRETISVRILKIAIFYKRHGKYTASLKRLNEIIDHYQGTETVETAKKIKTEILSIQKSKTSQE